MKKYAIILVNCDCCSTIIVRRSTKWIYGPRCPGCKKLLGFLSYKIDGYVSANSEFEACEIYKKKRSENKAS